MSVALYDNPATMCREAWRNGRLDGHLSASLLLNRSFRGDRSMPFWLNGAHPWKPGHVDGDSLAVPPLNPTLGHP